MWSSDCIRAHAGLSREEKDQKQEKTVRLLELLDPAYNGLKNGMNLPRVLTLHTKRSAGGGRLSEETTSLLLEVISLRRRDFVYCKKEIGRKADERHAYAIRSLIQLYNMYHPDRFTYSMFASYFLDDTPERERSFIFVANNQWQQQERHGPRDLASHWRQGSKASISSQGSASSSESSSIYSAGSAASSASSVATPTSYFASDRIAIVRPSSSGDRLEGNGKGAYVPPARRGEDKDILKKTMSSLLYRASAANRGVDGSGLVDSPRTSTERVISR